MIISHYPKAPEYLISTTGEVFGPGAGARRINAKPAYTKMNPRLRSGYKSVRVASLGREELVHRMVLETFYGDCPKGLECAHLDGDKLNCALSNLRWVSKLENQSHKLIHGTMPTGEKSGTAKLKKNDIPTIMASIDAGISFAEIGRRYGVHGCTIARIASGKTWSALILAKRAEGADQ